MGTAGGSLNEDGSMPGADEHELFRSRDILVRHVGRRGGRLCYVTFQSYTDVRTLDRPGFGEAFFRSRGIDAIHVINRENLWYQHAELPDALAVIRAVATNYGTTVAYGSSMGGYAALTYGNACGAQVGLGISPQFSIDPAIAPFENRWLFDAQRIVHRRDEPDPLPLQYIVYDPRDVLDNAHFELFAARSRTVGVRVPYAGHPVGSYLHETGMFGAVFEMAETRAEHVADIERALRSRRRMSGQYFFAMSRRVPPHRPSQKVAIARMAFDIEPASAAYASNAAAYLDAAGRYADARKMHDAALGLEPTSFHVQHAFVLHLEKSGPIREARELSERLVKDNPEVLLLRMTRRRLRRCERHMTPWGKVARHYGLDRMIDFVHELVTDGLPTVLKFVRSGSR